MNHYEEKLERRRQRLEERAAAKQAEGNSLYKRAHTMAEAIPFGQPILVGHHSEKRDRNYRNRIHNTFGRAFESMNEAKDLAGRAASVGTGGISSDDPEAITKLQAELAEAEAQQAFMVAANKVIKAFYKAGVRDESAGDDWARYLAKLQEVKPGIGAGTAKKLLEPDFCGRIGFADYQLTNNGANVRRIKARIEQLERDAGRETKEVLHNSGVKLVENAEANRVQMIFPGKPPAEQRQLLKSWGFRWSPSEGAWQRHLNGSGIFAAKQVLEKISGMAE